MMCTWQHFSWENELENASWMYRFGLFFKKEVILQKKIPTDLIAC